MSLSIWPTGNRMTTAVPCRMMSRFYQGLQNDHKGPWVQMTVGERMVNVCLRESDFERQAGGSVRIKADPFDLMMRRAKEAGVRIDVQRRSGERIGDLAAFSKRHPGYGLEWRLITEELIDIGANAAWEIGGRETRRLAFINAQWQLPVIREAQHELGMADLKGMADLQAATSIVRSILSKINKSETSNLALRLVATLSLEAETPTMPKLRFEDGKVVDFSAVRIIEERVTHHEDVRATLYGQSRSLQNPANRAKQIGPWGWFVEATR